LNSLLKEMINFQNERSFFQFPDTMADTKNFVLSPDGNIVEAPGNLIYSQDFVDEQYLPTTIEVKSYVEDDQRSVAEAYNMFNDIKPYPTLDMLNDNLAYGDKPISPDHFYYDTPNTIPNEEPPDDVWENVATKIVILNPDGTLSDEFMLPDGFDLENIQGLSSNQDTSPVITASPSSPALSINILQHPIPKKDLIDVQPSLRSNQAPRAVIESALTELKSLKHQADSFIKSEPQIYEHSQPVFLEQKENYILLEELNKLQMKPLELDKCGTLRSPQYSPVDYSLPTDPYPTSSTETTNHVDLKIRKPKTRMEALVPYNHRKTKSLGALGQALHGLPRDSRHQAVQICPICKFQATTKNPYRHLQDHLARVHFKERLARELPTVKPFKCPVEECNGKHYADWQAVMRHYIGNKHGILEKFVKETLAQDFPCQSVT